MSTDAKTEDTPSKNTRSKKQALKNGVADATTPTVNKGGVLATPNAKSTGTKLKATPKSATKKKDEEETETAIVSTKSGSANIADTLDKLRAENKASAEENAEENKVLAKRQTKLEKDHNKLEKNHKKLVKTVADNDKQTKAKFAAQSQQIKKVETEMATLRENQEGTQRDVARLRTAVTLLGSSMEESIIRVNQGIIGLSTSFVAGMRLLDARTKSNRNFASTVAFFAIVLAIVLGYYLLATTLLAITLGFYFLFNKK